MNLQNAMNLAKNYVIYADPNGDLGSFEPIEGKYIKDNNVWIITCRFTKEGIIKTSLVTIDNASWNVVEYKLLEG